MTAHRRTASWLILSLILGWLVLLPRPAHAQQSITLERLVIRLWPEFDRPDVLVLLSGQVAGEVSEPVELTFALPPGISLNAVAFANEETGELFTAEHSMEGDRLTLISPNGTFHIEFYDPAIQFDGETRRYSFEWAAGYAVNELQLEVQQPAGGRNLSVDPPGGVSDVDQFGLAIYTLTQTGLPAGEPVRITFSYEKTDNALTVDLLAPPTGEQPQAESVPSAGGVNIPWAWVAVGAGVLLAAGGGYWYFRQEREPPAPRARSGKRRQTGKRFCTQCGKAVEPGDKFCRHCGARLR